MKPLREKIKKFKEKTPDSELSTKIDPNEEKNSDDLSTTIDPNAVTNEDDGQRTDIGLDHYHFQQTEHWLCQKKLIIISPVLKCIPQLMTKPN